MELSSAGGWEELLPPEGCEAGLEEEALPPAGLEAGFEEAEDSGAVWEDSAGAESSEGSALSLWEDSSLLSSASAEDTSLLY